MHCVSTAVYSALDAKPKQILDPAIQISVALPGPAGRDWRTMWYNGGTMVVPGFGEGQRECPPRREVGGLRISDELP
jgi:hypothetical protein